MRKRPIEIKFRVSEKELKMLQEQLEVSGLNRNEYLVRLICNVPILPKAELALINKELNTHSQQLRGMATNINQIAKIANTYHLLPSTAQIEFVRMDIYQLREQLQEIWMKVRGVLNGNIENNIAWEK